MADKSLKDLTSAVVRIAENTPKIQKDVKDIRDAICGTEGILDSLMYITKRMESMEKKESLAKLTGKSRIQMERSLIRSNNSIDRTLNKILNSVQRISRGGRGSILTSDNFKDSP